MREVVEVINKYGLGTAFVLDERGVLLASVTDGDVRRALLAGHSLDSPASKSFNTQYWSIVYGEDAPATAYESPGPTTDFPVVDSEGRLVCVDAYPRNNPELSRENKVVIMAGGKGLRLRPLTESRPKPLLEIGGKPMLEHIIENLAREGFVNISVAINYLGGQIEDYFGNGSNFGVQISYLREEKELGTAGGLSLLSDPGSLPLVLMNGDLVLGASVGKMVDYHGKKEADITVGAKVIETTIPYGVLSAQGEVIRSIEEKPIYTDLANVGVYVMNSSVVASVPFNRAIDMPELILQHVEGGKVLAFPIHETWADLGRHADLQRADKLLSGD